MNIRVEYRKLGLAVVLGGALCVLSGCGDEQQPARAPTAASEVSRGSVYVVASEQPEAKKIADVLARRLADLGFPIVTAEDAAHDLTAHVDVSLREATGLLKVYVNGQPKKSYRARATVRFTGGDNALSEQSVEYDVEDGPSDDQLRALVATARSSGVQRYLADSRQRSRNEAARAEREREDAAEAKRERKLAAQREQHQQEETLWTGVVLSECSAPAQLDGCEPVKTYLSSYPNGAHAAEAKQALEAGTPLIAKLTDERDWRVARPEACAAPKLSTDCDGVSSYLSAQPAGTHVEEARGLLVKAEPKLAFIRKAEEQRARQEDAKADREADQAAKDAKRRELEECRKQTCLGGMCFNVRPGAFEICMDRCVKANCE